MQEKQLKLLGLVIIFIGLALMLFTFYQAYSNLKSPPMFNEASASGGTVSGSEQLDVNKAIAQAFAPLFNSVIPLVYSTSYLFVMGLVGFWIMGRGIQLVK